MIKVFLEEDLVNSTLENEKVKVLEEILNHLMMRVKNSTQVIPPHV